MKHPCHADGVILHRKVLIGDTWAEEPLIKQTKKMLTKLNAYSVKQRENQDYRSIYNTRPNQTGRYRE